MAAKLSFRKWLDLEETKKLAATATESGEFPDRLFAYLSVAFARPADQKEDWKNSVFSFLAAVKTFRPTADLPILKDIPTVRTKPASWEYEGRSWYYWLHLFASAYGWDADRVGNLDVNDALALAQEILTAEQLEHEFTHSLSEVAYPYNKSTKKSIYKPLTRPYWMKMVVPAPRKMKFRRDMLPLGIIQDVSGMPSEMNPLRDYIAQQNIQNKTEETDPPPSP